MTPSRSVSSLTAAFESVFARAQNQGTKRLFDLKNAGNFNLILPYLGQRDSSLQYAPVDFVSNESVAGYPTNFNAMKEDWINRLSRRGEQLVHAQLREHCGLRTALHHNLMVEADWELRGSGKRAGLLCRGSRCGRSRRR